MGPFEQQVKHLLVEYTMDPKYPDHPKYREEMYVEWDFDTAAWGVFGEESGFCYATFASKAEAEEWLDRLEAESQGW
jgi:hypothetical protein